MTAERIVCRTATRPTPPGCGHAFTKVTTGDIVTIPAQYWNGAWGDYDDDGYLDLFIGAGFAWTRNFLYHNNRDGTFTLIEDAKMPKLPSNQHGAAWGDYDNDGHLDLIATSGNSDLGHLSHNGLYHNNGDGTFTVITTGPIYADVGHFHGPSWGDYDNDGWLDLFIAGQAIHNRLFHNNGDGSFTRITTGVLVTDFANSEARAWIDYDNDGDLDLFVGNAPPDTNFLYRNDGNGSFTAVTNAVTMGTNAAASCWADYDNDGLPDLFVGAGRGQKNALYHNNGPSSPAGAFTNITDSAPVQEEPIATDQIFPGCAWADYDNDGFIDLFVGVADGVDFSPPYYLGPPRAHNLLYHNNGDGTFTKVTEGPVVNDLITQSPGATWGDYDNDGFVDLFVPQLKYYAEPQTSLLYHNNGNGNAWLNVKLVGTVSNRSAIGAKVRVKAFYRGENRWQLRDISAGEAEGNQSNALNAAFGLADATTIDTVRVEWPSGIVQELHDVAPRQFLTVTETP